MIRVSFDYYAFKKSLIGKLYRKYKLRKKRNLPTFNYLIRNIEFAERKYYEKTCKPQENIFSDSLEKRELSALRQFKFDVLIARSRYLQKC